MRCDSYLVPKLLVDASDISLMAQLHEKGFSFFSDMETSLRQARVISRNVDASTGSGPQVDAKMVGQLDDLGRRWANEIQALMDAAKKLATSRSPWAISFPAYKAFSPGHHQFGLDRGRQEEEEGIRKRHSHHSHSQ